MTLAALLAAARRLYFAFHIRFRASLHTNSNASVRYCFPRFSNLLDFSLLFQCREIPRRCCVGYMKQFLDFIVGDFALCVQGFQNLFEFLVLPVLNRCAGFHEEIASGMRGLQ